ncbi:ABC transporter ATP-binding protein [Parasediminibacterium sp. JCM 36343]|uniref:ABC transporter ATP-binding protein n=1 Tax=Parasediminibacterium sp. JCM 36343 TaxID=3374279 RepID=UPI00397B546A
MKNYLGLLRYLKPYRRNIILYFGFIVFAVVFSVVSLAMLFPFMEIIFNGDKLITVKPALEFSSAAVINVLQYYLSQLIIFHSKMFALSAVCVFIIVSIFLKNAAIYMSYYVMSPMRNGMMIQIKNNLYEKILTLPIGYFTEQRKGDLMSRMTNDLGELENAVTNTLDGLIKEPVTILFYLGTLIWLSPKLSLVLLVLLPLSGFIIGRISKSLKKQSNVAALKNAESLSILEETLSGMRVIKAFTAEKITRQKFFAVNDELFTVKNKMNFKRDLASPVSEVLGIVVLCIILWFGGRLILENKDFGLNGSAFIMYIAIFSQIINPSKSLSTAFYNMQRGTAALARIEEILQTTNTIVENPEGKQLQQFNHNIEFRNVTFAYHDAIILNNINLTIEKGKTVALVGSSGAGKSTLADLVPRFHDVTSGELLIDGVNIKDYTLESVRSQISIVTQEPILFNDTIANNILLGKQNASKEAIIDAATVANAYNFITQKEDGFNANIGDRGSKLSGGERQRLTIARAVLKNPPILILDEATSSLDTESERLVQDAINNMMQNRTSIVIAHRLSTIRHADEIIVLQKGNIVERGNHEQLLALAGVYKRLIDMQEVK